ncbi:hypothetical protein ALQ26_01913 [Pseudomonas amygdali pv. lachrymans]|nr:hypothetical protein ALQ26_01913 [Pseudomonas amygdali pv. lachrymans]
MTISLGQTPDCLETQLGPQRDSYFIAGHHRIELHRQKPAVARQLLRVLAHQSRYTTTPRRIRHHIAAIADMIPRTCRIGLQVIAAQQLAVFLGNQRVQRQLHPQTAGLLLSDGRVVGVGFLSDDDSLKGGPEALEVFRGHGADLDHGEALVGRA